MEGSDKQFSTKYRNEKPKQQIGPSKAIIPSFGHVRRGMPYCYTMGYQVHLQLVNGPMAPSIRSLLGSASLEGTHVYTLIDTRNQDLVNKQWF